MIMKIRPLIAKGLLNLIFKQFFGIIQLMKSLTNNFPNDTKQLKNLLFSERSLVQEKVSILEEKELVIEEKTREIKQLKEQNQYLLEQFRLARQHRFGKRSEVDTDSGQGELFNEAEQCLEEQAEAPETEIITYSRKKAARKPLPKHLPREVVIHDIDENEKQCTCCGNELHQMGEEKNEQLKFIPAQIKVIEHIRLKYSCRNCEKNDIKVPMMIAPRALSPIPKSIATPSLLSQIITSKYQYSLPLYRQESFFNQHQIDLSRQTMSQWMMKSATLFKPIIDYWHQVQLQQKILQADETTVNVLSEERAKCYMWVYCSGIDGPSDSAVPNIVIYDYQPSRHGYHAANYLQGYNGYLQVDGYAGYEQLHAILVACWAHARRKFKEAETAQGNKKTGKARWAINHIKKLYRIEALLKGKTIEEKYQKRQAESLPLLLQLKEWLDKSSRQVLPKSAIGKAIAYSLNQWDKLIRYIDDGGLTIDNNRAERAVKLFVIGRKNWLFSNTANGAEASAILYSIIETAKANGLTPFNYVMHLLEELPKQPDDLEYLMPWNVNLSATI